MMSFSKRLAICLRQGQMAQGDLHWWFERPRSTTVAWLDGIRTPRQDGAGAEAWRRLEILEQAIAAKKGFPVPHNLSLTERPHHIEKLYHDSSAGFSRKDTARGRVQMRNGVQ